MGYLSGLQEYLDEHYSDSVYDEALKSSGSYVFHVHDQKIIRGRVVSNDTYDVEIEESDSSTTLYPKTDIKIIYPANLQESLAKQIKLDTKVAKLQLPPIISSKERHHIKNKTLYPIMEEKLVVIFTMLEGEIVKGLIGGFSRYEIIVRVKGGVPLTIFRHAIFNAMDKKKRSYLKRFQDKAKDWQKSQLYITQNS